MVKKTLTILLFLCCTVSILNAQWTNEGGWPDTTYKGGTHAIAVDPDGKVWVASYYQDVDWVVAEGDTVATSGILVFNPDGTEADFSPITHFLLDGGFTVDTLNGACRGMEADENGNIVYVQSGPAMARKINYQTGEQMASHLTTEHGSSPTAPSIADDGTIFIGPVVGGAGTAIAMYDTDLNYIGNAVDGPQNISRVLTVSGDGNTIYWHAFTGPIHTVVYQRADEFSPYDSVGVILEGMSVESSHFNPATGNLWVSNDARGPDSTLAHLTWYEYDTDAGALTGDSFTWEPSDDATEYPRGLDFSPDGTIAYAGTFTTATPRIQKFTFSGGGATGNAWDNLGAFPDTTYKGGTHGIAVDPDGKVWVASYYQDVDWVVGEGDTVATSGILVFNPDGTEADFSPITHFLLDGGFTVDTLNGNCRGLEADENGNIVYVQSGPAMARKINYQTGEQMASHLTTEHGSSPTGAGIADDGTIFIGPVVGGAGTAIAMYDTDLNYIGNAVDGPQNISRVLEVSPDGNTIYWHAFTGPVHTVVYQRPDEFSGYDSVGVILEGVSVESSEFNPATGNLWVSHDARGPAPFLTHATWYEYDTESGQLLDYFTWEPNDDATEYPRALAFSPDGSIAYAGTFTTATPRIQRFSTGPVSIEPDILSGNVPNDFTLNQNYPNPFNPSTIISYSVPEPVFVTLRVYNTLGQEVAVLVNEEISAGTHNVRFQANNLATGIYVYTIQAGKFSASKKMMLMK